MIIRLLNKIIEYIDYMPEHRFKRSRIWHRVYKIADSTRTRILDRK